MRLPPGPARCRARQASNCAGSPWTFRRPSGCRARRAHGRDIMVDEAGRRPLNERVGFPVRMSGSNGVFQRSLGPPVEQGFPALGKAFWIDKEYVPGNLDGPHFFRRACKKKRKEKRKKEMKEVKKREEKEKETATDKLSNHGSPVSVIPKPIASSTNSFLICSP